MNGLENDDYIPDEGHLVSGKVRRPKHIEAGGPGGRPGQRGKNKREQGEKPVVTVKWNQQLTEQLWVLIKTKPELKRVLVNEPTRFLGPHGAAGSLFSKKDLQKTIAEQLFNDGTYDLADQTIMDNLTRAVKNKLHKTQMLYEASLRDLPPDFSEYQSELEIPSAQRAKWAKVKDRFPTYFEYHELAQEIPAIAKEMEVHAQQFGAWKAKALSGSEEGSPNSFISNNRHRSRSIDTSASWDVPDSPPLMNLHSGGDQDFEVLPPPADNRATSFSDMESYGGGAAGSALGGISPGVSPSIGAMPLQRSNSFHVDPTNRWSPNHTASMIALGPGGIGAGIPNGARATNDGVSPVWTPSRDHIVPSQLTLETQSYDPNGLQSGGPWSNTASPLLPGNSRPRYPGSQPFKNISPNAVFGDETSDGLHFMAQSLAQAGEARHGSDITTRKHRRGPSMGNKGGGPNLRSVSPQGTSPFSPEYSSASGSPDNMPGSADSPRDDRDMDALLQILREREKRKRQRDEEWLRFKNKRLEDRERQRIENQREREENEKRRQHEAAMMDRKIQMLQLETQLRRQQSDMQNGSVATSGSNMTSPVAYANGPSTNMNDSHHEMQYTDSITLFQQLSSNQVPQYDQHTHSLAMMGIGPPSHPVSPMHMSQALQQTSQQQQQRMDMLGMNQFHQSPSAHPELRGDTVPQMSLDSSMSGSFHQEQYNDSQLDEIFGGNM